MLDVREIEPSQIRDPEWNSRTLVDTKKLDSLAASIKQDGQRQPIEVEELPDGGFLLVFGSRRLAAVRLAGLPAVKAIVKPQTSRTARILSNALENVQREDLSTYEKARLLSQLREEKLSGKEMQAATGWSQSYISNLINAYNRLHPTVLADWQNNNDLDEEKRGPAVVSYLVELGKMPKEDQPAAWEAHKSSFDAAMSDLYDDEEDDDDEEDEDDDGERKPKSYSVKAERYNQVLRALKASKSPAIGLSVAQYLVGKIDRIKGLIEPPKEEKSLGTKPAKKE